MQTLYSTPNYHLIFFSPVTCRKTNPWIPSWHVAPLHYPL